MRFQAHGIKTSKGLEKCSYSLSSLTNGKTAITIYAEGYTRFSGDVRRAFEVKNESDVMTDYFENDRIRVYPDHPLAPMVAGGFKKNIAFRAKRCKYGNSEYMQRMTAELDAFAASAQ